MRERGGTTLDAAEIDALARAHDLARRTAVQIEPPSATRPGMTVDDSYAVQQRWVELMVEGGRRVVGRKVGLTSRAMQQAMHIDEPDFGALTDDMVIADGGTVAASAYCEPRLEVELAFGVHSHLRGAATSAADVLAATEWIAPAFELIDARSWRTDPVTGRTRTVVDTIADNAANAGFVLGEPADPHEHVMRWVGAILDVDGEVEETGLAAGVLGDPLRGVAWLVRRLAGLGAGVAAGEVVLSGSFTRPVPLLAGHRYCADFGILGQVALEAR